MEIRQPEHMRLIDDDGVGIGNVQTGFYNIGRHQHVVFSFDKAHHYFFEAASFHLPMGHSHFRIGYQFYNSVRYFLNIFYSVVYKENLSSTLNFIANGISNGVLIESIDLSGYRLAIGRWRGNDA